METQEFQLYYLFQQINAQLSKIKCYNYLMTYITKCNVELITKVQKRSTGLFRESIHI